MFSPQARDLLEGPANAVFCTLMPDGSPQAVVAGFVLDGDELVAHTAPRMQRVRNLRADPRITVLVVDPADPKRYVEVRGEATLREPSAAEAAPLFKAQAVKYGLPERAGSLPEGITVVQIRVKPTKVNYMEFTPERMGPKMGQRPGPAGS
ncbi:PPOX class F420-dependent oxidoreductase [Actinocorallia sp. A-T 12471]|uniref:PPOX class F420-dependent oxidoreductase n=1 Tax=Actinocorallia sp. A-T 12471 TaxID=3089813 RepID=UPI0029CCFEE0|nr:PPOX class F420-dependent oxidoreductase [Actinocorallia sp. A-T 12471]MDX6738166.1 PPOX class F420-dependent oxidoreductase [Actinocorallia sp. A-T 12471]